MEFIILVSIGLLVLGVAASFVPLVPGAALSLVGIYIYWFASGFTEPGTVFIVGATLIGITALLLDYLSTVISARVSGASLRTAIIAGIVGLVLLIPLSPLGAIIGAAVTVFIIEFLDTEDLQTSIKTAIYTTVTILVSTGMQVFLTASMLAGFLYVVIF